jgi:hypothetical protein
MEFGILGPLRIGGPGGVIRIGAKLWGAAGATRRPDEAAFAERVEGTLRDAVGPAAFTSAVAEGAALSQADAVALALADKGA